MSAKPQAVIDVGTNSVKLLIGEVRGSQVIPWLETSEQTRLGRGFYEHHQLQPEAIACTAKAVRQFMGMARDHGCDTIRLVATSAARDAENRAELVDAIRAASGLPLEIISGEQEAELAYQGVCSDLCLAQLPVLIMDTGGGSTQFVYRGQAGLIRRSFLLGAIRLLEKFPHANPPTREQLESCRGWLDDFIGGEILPVVRPWISSGHGAPVQLVGTGGASGLLASMHLRLPNFERQLIEAALITREQIQDCALGLWGKTLEERRQIIGLPPQKADVILMSALIHARVMANLKMNTLRVSTRGIRYGLMLGKTE